MGVFNNDDQQDARLDELEREMRRVVEEVQQLSIDLGVTRMELLRARIDLKAATKTADGAVQTSSIDPAIAALNDSASATRAKLKEAKASGEEQWDAIRKEVDQQLDDLKASVDKAWNDSGESATDAK
ncbi:MAG: hypothetical protein KDB86_02245 [Actinobacteria bacterium]|nr:hypothetical protein [Actinomycetota bacterium]MCB9388842.1 hypothetical protein [Acidimicrobiia bacterium]